MSRGMRSIRSASTAITMLLVLLMLLMFLRFMWLLRLVRGFVRLLRVLRSLGLRRRVHRSWLLDLRLVRDCRRCVYVCGRALLLSSRIRIVFPFAAATDALQEAAKQVGQ